MHFFFLFSARKSSCWFCCVTFINKAVSNTCSYRLKWNGVLSYKIIANKFIIEDDKSQQGHFWVVHFEIQTLFENRAVAIQNCLGLFFYQIYSIGKKKSMSTTFPLISSFNKFYLILLKRVSPKLTMYLYIHNVSHNKLMA